MAHSMLFAFRLHLDVASVDVAINFHVDPGRPHIEDPFLPLAAGKRKNREASGRRRQSQCKLVITISSHDNVAPLKDEKVAGANSASRSPIPRQPKKSRLAKN